MVEYEMIKEFYSDKVAKRSGVKLINHINEGLDILNCLNACLYTKAAFCLHPLLQDDQELQKNMDHVINHSNPKAILLAMEYRNKAQSYLCKEHTDHWNKKDIEIYVGKLLPEIRLMLIADKKQNQKDFNLYHKNTHPRSYQLEKYFKNWLEYLEAE